MDAYLHYAPQTVTDGEIGIKTDWSIGSIRGRTNLAGFIAKFRGLQLSASGLAPGADGDGNPLNDPSNTSLFLNAGSAKTRGIDLDGFIDPVPNLRLSYSLNLFRGRIRYDIPVAFQAFVSSSNTRFNYAPTNAYTLAAQYIVPGVAGGELALNVNYYRTAKYKVDFADIPAYGLLGASIDLAKIAGTGITAQLFGQNLTNKTFFANPNASGSFPGYQTFQIGAPRMYGIRIRYDFGR